MRKKDNASLVDRYIQQLFAVEDQVLLSVREQMQELKLDGMSISSNEGRMLQVFMKMAQVKTVVEVGTFLGYSSIWIARALPTDGALICLELDSAHALKAQKNMENAGLTKKVQIMQGSADESLKKISNQGPFDMVFIDADKPGYLNYLDWAEKNVRTGGLIIGDNTFLFDSVYLPERPAEQSEKRWQTMREFNRRLADPTKYTSILVATDEGMTVAVKNF